MGTSLTNLFHQGAFCWPLPVKPHLSIYKMFTERVSSLGFARLKTAWWERRRDLVLQKIHLHKFSYTTSFRVHAAVHVLGYDEDVHWLNGMCSHDGWFEKRPMRMPFRRHDLDASEQYDFDYTEESSSWRRSADSLFDFTKEVLIPWFDRWPDISRLLSDSASPLRDGQRAFLRREMSSKSNGPTAS